MTALGTRPSPAPATGVRAPAAGPSGGADLTAVSRTLRAWVAVALAAVPLSQIFTDHGWLVQVWLAEAVALLPILLLRLWWRPRLWQLLAGAALGVVWLTARFVPDHAFGGLVPSRSTWQDVTLQVATLQTTVRDRVAPLHTTPEIVLSLAAGVIAFGLVVDAIAVVLRRPALGGLPLLLVFTMSGSIPRQPVSWLYFVAAAAGFLLLLSSDGTDVLTRWGRVMPRRGGGPAGGSRSASLLARSARPISVIAVAAAVVVPLVLPARPGNPLANALHTSNGNGIGGGTGPGVSLNPFVSLRGQLVRGDPQRLVTVQVADVGNTAPYYLRANVLDVYDGTQWATSGHGPTERAGANGYPTDLPQATTGTTFQASFSINGLRDAPPLFATPTRARNLPGGTQWSSRDQLLIGSVVQDGASYSESVFQLVPTVAQLRAAPRARGPLYDRWLQLPNVPGQVRTLVDQLTADSASGYDAALALLGYLSPNNGFNYSLQTIPANSGNDLVDFLFTSKTGYCQQYAASLAVMLRLARIPARVVLGYTHDTPDKQGSFTVTTSDAHAWVEAYFPGVGWVPFDPTPLTGSDAARQVALPWVPRANQNTPTSGSSDASSSGSEAGKPAEAPDAGGAAPQGDATTTAAGSGTDWIKVGSVCGVALIILLLALSPALVRATRRRRRLRAGRAGDADALWAELAATATDLGYVWSPAHSPRQAAGALSAAVGPEGRASLSELATAVERARYAPARTADAPATTGPDGGHWAQALSTVESALRDRQGLPTRVLARVHPASLRWQILPSVRLPRLGRSRGGRS